MNLLIRLKHLKKEYLTFMIIPHSGQGTKQVKINKLLLYTVLSSITLLTTFLFLLIFTYVYTNNELHAYKKNLHQLQTINEQQALEINNLKNKADTVTKKLSLITELELTVRKMVGLAEASAETSSTPQSNTMEQSESDEFNNSIPPGDPEDSVDLESLASDMDKEIEKLTGLINDVDGQLKVLDKIPDLMPTSGKITSKFGYRTSPFTGKRQFHKGLDISNNKGTKIIAAGTGIVTFSGWNAGYGKTIIISHGNGYRSVYAHNSENIVTVGQKVSKGESIAKMGSTGRSTGPHLHFEIHHNGEQINPEKVLKK